MQKVPNESVRNFFLVPGAGELRRRIGTYLLTRHTQIDIARLKIALDELRYLTLPIPIKPFRDALQEEYGREVRIVHERGIQEAYSRLTERFGLHLAPGKEAVRRERLREPDRTRYEIYDTIQQELPRCRNWTELQDRLKRHGIETIFKRKGAQDVIEGVKFARNGFVFSGSKVDSDRAAASSDLRAAGAD